VNVDAGKRPPLAGRLAAAAPFAGWIERATARRAATPGGRLGRRQVFILPTRFGLLAAAATVTMFLVALNYQNSLVFLLTFLLGALGVAAMIACHRQLRGLHAGPFTVPPVFAGDGPELRLTVTNPGRAPRLGLHLVAGRDAGPLRDVPGRSTIELAVSLAARPRGSHRLAPAELASAEPLGAFRSWSRIGPVPALVVYPRPAESAPAPPGGGWAMQRGPHAADDPEDFTGLARYRAGDRPSQLAWSAYARTGELHRKTFSARRGGARWFDYANAPGPDAEARLSVLCRWLLDAAAGDAPWGLMLPEHRIPPARGAAHLHRCLRALALYPGPYG